MATTAHATLTLSAFGKARSTVSGAPLNAEELRKTDAFWRACNYLMLGMIYLQDNPLLREPLKPEHIKNRLLGHWGSSPGLAFAYIHLMRQIKKYDLDMIFLAGPGHGAPGVLAPSIWRDRIPRFIPKRAKMRRGCMNFSDSSLSLAESEVIARPKHRVRYMKAVNLATCSLMLVAPPLIIRI